MCCLLSLPLINAILDLPAMKAVFFDRDGVLNKELGRYVTHAEEFEVNDWVVPFMKVMKENGYKFFVITNQGGIAKGLYTKNDLFDIHNKLKQHVEAEGLFFTEIYFCPHHPLHTQCLCRKPNSITLEKAIAKYGVDVSKSFMIGDSERDIEAAQKVGLQAFRVIPNQPLSEMQVSDLESFIDFSISL